MGLGDRLFRVGGGGELGDDFAGDGGVDGQIAGRIGLGGHAEPGKQRADFILDGAVMVLVIRGYRLLRLNLQ